MTDEFIAHIRTIREAEQEWDLSQASEFLLVAATLLDLKAARLLPQTGPEDDDDLALIEARDLLFARLLQYRAYKDIAHAFGERMATAGRMHPPPGRPRAPLRRAAARAHHGHHPGAARDDRRPRHDPQGAADGRVEHLHAPGGQRPRAGRHSSWRGCGRDRVCSFRALVADADTTMLIVARFLALLELYKEGAITFDQAEPLADLAVRWTGADEGDGRGQRRVRRGRDDGDRPSRPTRETRRRRRSGPDERRDGPPTSEELP